MTKPSAEAVGLRLNIVGKGITRQPTYALGGPPRGRGSGTYNLSLLWIIVCAALLFWRGSVTAVAVAGLLLGHAAIALVIDDEPWSKKVSFSSLPRQVASYVALVKGALVDVAPCFVLLALAYAVASPKLASIDLGLTPERAFWALYGTYVVSRAAYLAFVWLTAERRWLGKQSPFLAHHANARTVPIARRHAAWAFFWGNVGLTVRCGKQLAFVTLLDALLRPAQPTLAAFPQAWVVAIPLMLVAMYLYGNLPVLIFYKVHRTAHEDDGLYHGMHKIHHKGVYPSLLDSGTESPAEFLLTETPAPWLAFPTWAFLAVELISLGLHFAGHISRHTNHAGSVWHLNHHRFQSANYGVLPEHLDARFGTARNEPYL